MDFPRAVDQLALFRGGFFGTILACAIEPFCLDSTLVYHSSVFLVRGNDVSAGSRTHPRRGQSFDIFCPLSVADGFLQRHGIRALWGRQTSSHEQRTSHFRTHTASAQSARGLAGGSSGVFGRAGPMPPSPISSVFPRHRKGMVRCSNRDSLH